VGKKAHSRHELHVPTDQARPCDWRPRWGQSPACDALPCPEGTRLRLLVLAGHDYSGVVIRARGVEKRYGDKRVLRGVRFDLARDGFLLVTGPNGSGKTTLLRLCAGLAIPTSGELEVTLERGRLGYLAHEPLVYRELTALENLDLYGKLYRVAERRERIGMLLERFGLWDARHDRADSYSRGMMQRLALCRTLLHDPDLLVLDEPYSGLDEEGASLLDRELEERRPSCAFLVSTHDPARIERFATSKLALA
jgi:heme exporter protein A